MKKGFRQMLIERQRESNSLLCVGLDPVLEKMPKWAYNHGVSNATAVYHWMKEVVKVTAPYASMYKPNRAYYESIWDGEKVLRDLTAFIISDYPTIPIFGDVKRGDIDRTQRQYSVAHFDLDGVGGMNYNQYMGIDTLKSLIDSKDLGRSYVGLGRTSNETAWAVQDLRLEDGRQIWEVWVQNAFEWSRKLGVLENAGVVMGAAFSTVPKPKKGQIHGEYLWRAWKIHEGTLWTLIPGIGTQNGFMEATIENALHGPGSIAVNMSSAIGNSDNPGSVAQQASVEMRAVYGTL